MKEVLCARGLYLFSGPVGSGKTTLMYQLASEVFKNKQIITIEDPVEIKNDKMLQLQLNEDIGMTYDALIKLSLRHRPDILIIGEIRDQATARAVIRASLTGVMVFSTIHAKSIPGVYDRLIELGVNYQELENSLKLIAYQRLIGGGSLIDFETSNFKKHSSDKWISWLKKDISVRNRHKSKKLSLKKQRKVVQLFNNLFASGFSLTDMVTFLKRSKLLSDCYTDRMNKALLEGKDLSKMLGELGFSDTVITQVALADLHGNISRSLLKIESYLANLLLVRKKVIEVATYPLILLSFLVLIMIGLRHYLMPQLGENNFATRLITNVPNIFLLLLAVVLIFSLIFYIIQKRLSRIKVACFLTTIPLVGSYVKLYLTAYYAREWGNLLSQGVELDQIVKVMQNQKSKLFREIGYDMEEGFLSGKAFHQKVLDYPFFLTELSLMIEYGQVKAKLGTELDIYADEKWEDFFTKLARATQLIQPVIFIFVALIIVMIYAAMLLPMYQNMEILS